MSGNYDEYVVDPQEQAIIKVIGVGGGGGNAIAHMMEQTITGIEFSAANTDIQALKKIETIYQNTVEKTQQPFPFRSIKLGAETTRGLGAGAKPEVGQKAIQESIDEVRDYLQGADMVFITAGMGGGTGTGAAPVVAELAKQMGILTVGVVTRPFSFEGRPRSNSAEQGIRALSEHVDSLIIIPNDKLLSTMGRNTSLTDCFNQANNVLHNAVQGISDLIIRPGLINVDFADVKTVMSSMGMTMMGTGIAEGENRAIEATHKAINSPLLEQIDIKGAKGILVNIIASNDLSIGEFNEIGEVIRDYADPDANIVIGSSTDESLQGQLMVTLVATGVNSGYAQSKPANQMGAGRGTGQQSGYRGGNAGYSSNGMNRHYGESPSVHQGQQYQTQAQAQAPVQERSVPEAEFDGDEGIGSVRVVKDSRQAAEERNKQFKEQQQGYNDRRPDPYAIRATEEPDYSSTRGVQAPPPQEKEKSGFGIPSFLRRNNK